MGKDIFVEKKTSRIYVLEFDDLESQTSFLEGQDKNESLRPVSFSELKQNFVRYCEEAVKTEKGEDPQKSKGEKI